MLGRSRRLATRRECVSAAGKDEGAGSDERGTEHENPGSNEVQADFVGEQQVAREPGEGSIGAGEQRAEHEQQHHPQPRPF
jgi:hypothetical protein